MIKDCTTTELVSIITICLNAKDTIRQTIESVSSQTYNNIEYIICDGGSSDGTQDIINEYADMIDIFISEPDRGIADAFNKGICRASGAYIQLLNADDSMPPDKIELSVQALKQDNTASYVFGDVFFTTVEGLIMKIAGDPLYSSKITYGMPRLNHTTMLVRASAYQAHGLYDGSWKIAMDYDWLLRIHNAGGFGIYCPDVRTYMRDGGASSNWRKTLEEQRRIAVNRGGHAILAWYFYMYSILKISTRIVLESFLPSRLLMWCRPGKSLKNP
ncbi:MAG: glycosyltransferase [Desulfuromonadales bacterium]|nr:glycosyltransferase [Desulfuromonadales bacterium]